MEGGVKQTMAAMSLVLKRYQQNHESDLGEQIAY